MEGKIASGFRTRGRAAHANLRAVPAQTLEDLRERHARLRAPIDRRGALDDPLIRMPVRREQFHAAEIAPDELRLRCAHDDERSSVVSVRAPQIVAVLRADCGRQAVARAVKIERARVRVRVRENAGTRTDRWWKAAVRRGDV